MWRNIIILSLLILLPLGGYSIYWWIAAGSLKEVAQKNLDESIVRFKAAGVDLSYDDMLVVGYPALPYIKLYSPVMARDGNGMKMSIAADELIIEPDGREDQVFRILIPQLIQASYTGYDSNGRYTVTANFVPKLTVRTAGAFTKDSQGKRPIMLNLKSNNVPPPPDMDKELLYEYALNMPKNMLMKVEKSGKTAPIGFQWPLIPYRIWQPMRYDLGNSYDLFFAFLQEADSKM